MTALEKFVSCIIEAAEKAPPNTSIADLMGSMGWVNKQAEPLQGGLTDREICAWKMGYDAAKAEQADPTEGNPSY